MIIKTKNEKLTDKLEKTEEKLLISIKRIKELEHQSDLKNYELIVSFVRI
jgi:hypothetical protein